MTPNLSGFMTSALKERTADTEASAEERAPARRRGPVKAAIVAMRPQEWIKNLLVYAGLLFSGKFDEIDAIVAATVTFAAFCAVASAGYLINDAHDAELDRQHPTKRRRPIAAGELSIRTAVILAVVLIVVGLAGAALPRARSSAASCSPTGSAPRSTPTCSRPRSSST